MWKKFVVCVTGSLLCSPLVFGNPLTWGHAGDGFEIAEEGGLRAEPRLYGNTGSLGIGLTQ